MQPIPDNVKKELITALGTIAKYMGKNCFLCGKEVKIAKSVYDFRTQKGALYIRNLLICPSCGENRATEVDELKRGDRFDFGIFDI